MAERRLDSRPVSPDQAADQVRDAGKVSGLAQIGILGHADEIATVQSVRLKRETLRLARKYGAASPQAVQAAVRVDQHKSYRRALAREFDRATVPVPAIDPNAAIVYGRVFAADGKPLSDWIVTVTGLSNSKTPPRSSPTGADGAYLVSVPVKTAQKIGLRVIPADTKTTGEEFEAGPIQVDKGQRVFRDLRQPPPRQTPPKPGPGGDGAPPKPGRMPDLRGASEADARTILGGLGVTAIRVSTEAAAGATPGKVLKQSPAKDTALTLLSRVTLVVGARPPVSMPDLRGLTLQEAAVTLNQLGLKLGKVGGNPEKGRIKEQDPAAGEDAPAGGTVDLRFGKKG
jgi:hypothetical protein